MSEIVTSQKPLYSIVESNRPDNFTIKDTVSHETFEVARVVKGDEKASFKGLPPKLEAFLFNYSAKDVHDNPQEVIECLITMFDARGEGDSSSEYMDESEYQTIIQEKSVFKEEDPAQFYDIISNIG